MRTVNPQKAEIRKREILEAAKSCFEQKGFHATTMAEICTRANISPGALYRYFDSKEAIIESMSQENSFRAIEAFETALLEIRAGRDFADAFNELLDGIIANYCNREHGAMAAELIAEAMRNQTFADGCSRAYFELHQKLIAIIDCGQDICAVSKNINANEASTMIMAAIDGLVLRLAFCGDISTENTSDWLKNMFMRYLGINENNPKQKKSHNGGVSNDA